MYGGHPFRQHSFQQLPKNSSKWLDSLRGSTYCGPCNSGNVPQNPPRSCGFSSGLRMRHAQRLSALAVTKLAEPGRYAVGDGAYLQISPSGTRSWLFRYMLDGKARQMGLGSCEIVTLAEARQKAQNA